jgi:hypothetical protein
MATARPFAYNTSGTIAGTIQVGNLAVGFPTSGFTNSPQFWNGPDEELGYVIAQAVSGNTQPTQIPEDTLFLSPTYKGTDIQLSNNNQTASQLFGYQQSVLGINLIGTTDKVMFSVLCTLAAPATLPDSHFVGIGYTTMNFSGNPYGGFPGNDSQSLGYSSAGDIWLGGVNYGGGLQTWGNNDIIDVVIDNNTSRLWARVNGGNWNNNPAANPTTGSNGIVIIVGPFYPVLCPAYEGTMIIQNSPAYSVPSGYNFLGNITASVGFFRTNGLDENEFVQLANTVSNSNYTTASEASLGLTASGYWNSYVPPPTQTQTPTQTPTTTTTLTATSTPTNTPTQTQTQTQTPTNTPTNTGTPTQTPTQTRTPTTQTPTPTPTVTPSPTPFTPLAGSLLFNGSNQTLGLSPGVTFGAGAFTLEGWFYNNSNFTTRGIIGSPVTSPVGCMNLYFANNTTITSDRNGGGGSFSYTMGSAITTNAWHYLIYNRNAGGLTAVYIDGVRCTATSTDTLNYNTATDTVSRYYGGYWPGYWTNMRMTIGTAVYDSSLTTQVNPRGPLTSLGNTKYLMLGAAVTTDTSGTQTVTNNNTVTQTSLVKPF